MVLKNTLGDVRKIFIYLFIYLFYFILFFILFFNLFYFFHEFKRHQGIGIRIGKHSGGIGKHA
jgi:hypothetical protein